MNRVIVCILIAIAVTAGIFGGQLALRSVFVREKVGRLCGRGHLLALVHGRGIYQSDVDRTVHESDYANDIERKGATDIEQRFALNKLIADSAARSHAVSEKIPAVNLKRNLDLLRLQFSTEKTWQLSLAASRLSVASLSRKLRDDLRVQQWISKRIAHDVDVSENECRDFYISHSANFFVPERIRVAHLFLAAPPETAPDIVEAKQAAIEALSVRLATGEDFGSLTAEASADEATKLNAGDLGYVSVNRMPPDFMSAALKLRPGETSGPVRTRLGFHIIKAIDRQAPHQRAFENARGEIAIQLANQKREAAVKQLIVDLRGEAEVLRPL
jgi:parvulin-like peptidyl-prolyl isomerase